MTPSFSTHNITSLPLSFFGPLNLSMICIYMYILENVRYCIPTLHNISWCAVIISSNYYSNNDIINKAYNIIQALNVLMTHLASLYTFFTTFNRELKYCCFYFHWIKLRICNVTTLKLFQQREKYSCFNHSRLSTG